MTGQNGVHLERRMSSSKRRVSRRRWAKVRRLVLDQSGWRCEKCGKAGILQVDHKTPLKDGGDLYDLANLQTLCVADHWAKTAAEMGYRIPGPERAAWADYLAKMV